MKQLLRKFTERKKLACGQMAEMANPREDWGGKSEPMAIQKLNTDQEKEKHFLAAFVGKLRATVYNHTFL